MPAIAGEIRSSYPSYTHKEVRKYASENEKSDYSDHNRRITTCVDCKLGVHW